MPRINVYEIDELTGEKTLEGWFDPAKSRQWDGRREWDGTHMADIHAGPNRFQALYHTPGGRWVLNWWSQYRGEGEIYKFITDEQAREWLILNEDDEAVVAFFGALSEEAGPGRPAIGPRITIAIPETLLDLVDAARRDGEPRAETIRRLLAAALDEADGAA